MLKTLKIEWLKDLVNEYIENPNTTHLERKALCTVIETVLHETGNYEGYNYNYWLDVGFDEWLADGEPEKDKGKYLYGETGDYLNRRYF